MGQSEAASWMVEAIVLKDLQVPIHLDSMQPIPNSVIVQWTSAVGSLNCLVAGPAIVTVHQYIRINMIGSNSKLSALS